MMSATPCHIIFCANKKASVSASMDYLSLKGYVASFVQNEDELLNLVKINKQSIVIIELDFKSKDAITLTNELKQINNNTFVIIFTDKLDDYVQITAFDNGADDFVIAPLKPILLQKRIEAIANRLVPDHLSIHKNSEKHFSIDKETYTILLDKKTYTLPRKEFEMLHLMYTHSNKVFTRHEFSEKIWKEKLDPKSRIIDIHIRNIRKTLGEDVIKTIKGTGYFFNSTLLK